jgi:Zn-finger protein
VNFLMFFSFDLGTKLKTCNTYWPKVSGWHCAILCFFYVVTFKKLGWTVMDRGGHSWSCLLNSLPSECQRYLELISPWYPHEIPMILSQ